MSDRTTSPDMRNATSSPVSADGLTLADLLDGPMSVPSGPVRARASRSASRARDKVSRTTATCGQLGEISSRSAALQSLLENRLRRRLNGSDLCEVIWKPWATPWGQSLSKPRARVRTTNGTGFGLWPSPTAQDGARGTGTIRPHDTGIPLPQRVAQALWPTPTSLAPAKGGNNEAGNSAGLVAIRQYAMWSTPRASDGEKGGPNQSFGAGGQPLPAQAVWATPTSRDHKDGTFTPNVEVNGLLGRQVWDGSQGQTEKRGVLNPEFVSWLMGYPPEWLSCAPSAMPSSRNSRRKSSPRTPMEVSDLIG